MLEGKAILIVEDDLALSEMYAERLKQEGAVILLAHDGKEALKMVSEDSPSLILLDIMMPEMNGFEVLTALKQDEATKNIPVVMYTVLLEADKYKRAMDLGADAYIVKGESDPAQVVNEIKSLLAKQEEHTHAS